MTITKNVLKFYDISLDKRMQFGTISQQPTANSQQPTANSQQPTSVLNKDNIQYSNNMFNETERFRIFSGRSFFMPFWQFVMLNLFQHPDSETSSQ